ncbi:hypothetical protein L9F63_026950, partial [Diploptera punctata]
MAELWALLHFIMPTLFDSHDEFNEWFSKDIESHAENKTGIDEKHLSRLHMILKPFMLRRIKKDVENELSDKIEIMVYCPLTTRQKLLYSVLGEQKIRIEDLLYSYSGNQTSQSVHPDSCFHDIAISNIIMFIVRCVIIQSYLSDEEAKSPLFVSSAEYIMPKLLLMMDWRGKKKLINSFYSCIVQNFISLSFIVRQQKIEKKGIQNKFQKASFSLSPS